MARTWKEESTARWIFVVLCPERERELGVGLLLGHGAVRKMKVWPFGVALRGEAVNRLMLRWLKTVVVSDEEKAS